jgi:hypothetical protein
MRSTGQLVARPIGCGPFCRRSGDSFAHPTAVCLLQAALHAQFDFCCLSQDDYERLAQARCGYAMEIDAGRKESTGIRDLAQHAHQQRRVPILQ